MEDILCDEKVLIGTIKLIIDLLFLMSNDFSDTNACKFPHSNVFELIIEYCFLILEYSMYGGLPIIISNPPF